MGPKEALGMMLQVCNPSTQQGEIQGSRVKANFNITASSQQAWDTLVGGGRQIRKKHENDLQVGICN